MCKKYAVMILMVSMIPMMFWAKEEEGEPINAEIVGQRDIDTVNCSLPEISGSRPFIYMESAQIKPYISISEDDKMILYKIVEAEAGSEDRIGKILVANVILNRVKHEKFPDTVVEVVYQQDGDVVQFSPVANGSLEEAVPNSDTIEAVDAALTGEDYSEGALFFAARKYAEDDNMKWFDENLEKVTEHGGHEFYR